jgi:SAM-dependent methyltransferase
MSDSNTIVDFVGYEVLTAYITDHRLYSLEGDFIEVGAFVGGGTQKLAALAKRYNKKVFVIDIFDPQADDTAIIDSVRMNDIYLAFLEGRSQYIEFCNNTRGFDNIVTIKQDSKLVKFKSNQRFSFGFVDGNHHPDYVTNDFLLVWKHLIPGGVLALHDYRSGLPKVTNAIDSLLQKYCRSIALTSEMKDKHIILVTKKEKPVFFLYNKGI